MGKRQHTGDPLHRLEAIRAHEIRRLFRKVSLSPEQREAVENLSYSLVDELVYGPIAETIARIQEPSESAAIGETSHARSGTKSRGVVASAL
jgi:Glutamyl-tRNAGlu reductase, dimerisation domain